MEYGECIRWLRTLPDFERTGDFAERPDIAPMLALLNELGDPHTASRTPVVHLAGSKGKGSTGAIVEAVLRTAGLRTGHYISPHLHRHTERIRIDGAPISDAGFAGAMTAVRAAIEAVAPRFPQRQLLAFDALTAAAFVAFREAGTGAHVVEVGLGGLLDSTNVFHAPPGEDARAAPHVAVMTPISLEHTQILGDTVQAIARQKAGIIAAGSTVVVAPQRESAIDVFTETARAQGATILEVAKACQVERKSASAEGQEFRLRTARATYSARLPLAGRHQLENAATAIVAAEELLALAGQPAPDPAAVRAGLAGLKWPGRLETLKQRPRVIVDGAHNGDSVKRMVAALREDCGLGSAVLLFGTLAGKDIEAMAAQAAPFASSVVATAWDSPRAADPRDVAAALRAHDVPVTAYGSLPQAYEAALTEASDGGAVVAFGSLAFVAAVREWVLGIERD